MTHAATSTKIPGSDREQQDRALFDGIASKYTSKDLHPTASIARRQRLWRTFDAASLPRDPAILEAGCGAGFTARYLRGRFGSFVGIDYAEKLIGAANQYNAMDGVRFETKNIKQIDLDQQFDAVVMIGVLHHLDDMDAAMAQLVKTLKPGGWLLANEPQPGNPLIRGVRHIRKRLDKSYSDDQDQLTGEAMRPLYKRHGLVDIQMVPQGLFSTPFAEVPVGPTWLTAPIARACCIADTAIESVCRPLLSRVTWNLIARGRKP